MVAGAKRRGKWQLNSQVLPVFIRLSVVQLKDLLLSVRDERSSEEEASDEGEAPTGGHYLQRHGRLEQRDPATLGHHVRPRGSGNVCGERSFKFPPHVLCSLSCSQEGNEAGQGSLVAGTSSQRQRKGVEPRHRQRAQHNARYSETPSSFDSCLNWLVVSSFNPLHVLNAEWGQIRSVGVQRWKKKKQGRVKDNQECSTWLCVFISFETLLYQRFLSANVSADSFELFRQILGRKKTSVGSFLGDILMYQSTYLIK